VFPNLVVWGDFTQVGNLSAPSIARWNSFNNAWSSVGTNVVGSSGLGQGPLAVVQIQGSGGLNDIDYVAVGVAQAGGLPVDGLARWTGSAWQNYAGAGTARLSGNFLAAINFQGVTVGGLDLNVNASPRYGLSRWTGTLWGNAATAQGTDGRATALLTHAGQVYAAGEFTRLDSVLANRIARREVVAGTWVSLGSGLDGPALC
jgi:hypothetical protein